MWSTTASRSRSSRRGSSTRARADAACPPTLHNPRAGDCDGRRRQRPNLGLRLTLFILEARIREATLGDGYDPKPVGYSEYILYLEYGRAHEVDVRGDLALMVFTTSPLASPHFLRRTAAGWQMDIWAEVHDTRNYIGGAYTWGFNATGDDFSRAFADRLLLVGAVPRIAGGDNRTLPTHKQR